MDLQPHIKNGFADINDATVTNFFFKWCYVEGVSSIFDFQSFRPTIETIPTMSLLNTYYLNNAPAPFKYGLAPYFYAVTFLGILYRAEYVEKVYSLLLFWIPGPVKPASIFEKRKGFLLDSRNLEF